MRARFRWSVGLAGALSAVTLAALIAPPPAPAQPAKARPVGLEVVPTEGFVVVTVNVARIYDADVAKPVRAAFEKGDRAFLKRVEADTGFAPEQVDRVTAFLPTPTYTLTDAPVLFVTTRKPFDKPKLLQTLKATTTPPGGAVPPNMSGVVFQGIALPAGAGAFGGPVPVAAPDPAKPAGEKSNEKKPLDPNAPLYYVGSGGESVLIPIDDRTVAVLPNQSYGSGGPGLVAALLRRKADGPLAEAIALADTHQVTMAVTGKHLREWFKIYREGVTEVTAPVFDGDGNPVQPVKPVKDPEADDDLTPFDPLAEFDRAVVTLDVGEETVVKLTATFPSSEAAKRGEKSAQDGVKLLTTLLTAGKQAAAASAADQDLPPIYDFALAGLAAAKTAAAGPVLTVTATAGAGAALKTALLALPERLQTAADRIRTQGNLTKIGLAVQNYEAANGHLPQDLTDSDGKVLHSWRVHLLPYLEANDLFTRIDRTKPWDDPANKQFWDQMPDVFQVSGRPAPAKGHTYLQAFRTVNWVGANDTWMVDNKKVTSADVSDGTHQTLAAVETEAAVNWMKPDDILFDPKKLPPIGDPKTGRAHAVMLDASVHVLDRRKYTGERLKALVTANGGEDVDLGN